MTILPFGIHTVPSLQNLDVVVSVNAISERYNDRVDNLFCSFVHNLILIRRLSVPCSY